MSFQRNQMSEYKAPSKIIGVQFSILSPEEIRKNSVVEVTSRDTSSGRYLFKYSASCFFTSSALFKKLFFDIIIK